MLWCSHDTEWPKCQDSSVSVETGTRPENQVLPSELPDLFITLRRTALALLYLFIVIAVKISHLFCFTWPVGHRTIDMERQYVYCTHDGIHNWKLMLECPSVYLMWTLYSRQSNEHTYSEPTSEIMDEIRWFCNLVQMEIWEICNSTDRGCLHNCHVFIELRMC